VLTPVVHRFSSGTTDHMTCCMLYDKLMATTCFDLLLPSFRLMIDCLLIMSTNSLVAAVITLSTRWFTDPKSRMSSGRW